MLKHVATAVLLGAALTMPFDDSAAQGASNDLRKFFDSRNVPVTVDNFVRAATDIEFGKYVALSGGINKVLHIREPTPIDQQPTIRMNRDTLYSMAVIDITEGATLTLPDGGNRYISAQIVNQDHYMNKVFLGAGTYELDFDTFDTPFVVMIVRLLVDASDPDDIAEVSALQDKITLEAKSAKPFISPHYDEKSFDGVLQAALSLSRFIPDSRATFGPKSEVDPIRHFLGAAFGWGGLPEESAFYLSIDPNRPVGEYKIDIPAAVPVDAFWSISVYNADGFFEENETGVYNVNSVSGAENDDGSMTVHLGGCGDGRVNCIPLTDGWNYAVRLYQPGPEILDGTWTFPKAVPVSTD
ncbi:MULTISPECIES: DUF1214 domain-containing protein [unclassified Ruegeria]|uniref:DUF1214 domain-containing protein n=1 Tax=unclassified Ruegeria TaxID=2625375 RepID=UPI001C12764C|nr:MULTISPECIES: DUF1214 domain-containing protein [unclassified Ruegeria]